MMNSSAHTPEVIVSGIHLDLTPSLKFYVNEKVGGCCVMRNGLFGSGSSSC